MAGRRARLRPVAQLHQRRDLLDHLQQVARPEGHPLARVRRQARGAPAGRRRTHAAVRLRLPALGGRPRRGRVQRHHRRAHRAPLRRRGQHRPRAVPRGRLGAWPGDADRRRARRPLRDRGRLLPLDQRGRRDDREQSSFPSARTGPFPTARARSAKSPKACKLRAAAYTGLRLPTLNELYRPVRGVPGHHQRQRRAREREARGLRGGDRLARGGHGQLFADRVRQRGRERDHQRHHRHQLAPAAQHRRDPGAGARAGDADDVRRSSASTARSRWTDAEMRASGAAAALDGLRPAQTPEVGGERHVQLEAERRNDRSRRRCATSTSNTRTTCRPTRCRPRPRSTCSRKCTWSTS